MATKKAKKKAHERLNEIYQEIIELDGVLYSVHCKKGHRFECVGYAHGTACNLIRSMKKLPSNGWHMGPFQFRRDDSIFLFVEPHIVKSK